MFGLHVTQVRGGKLATAEGVSYLEAKHLLLLHYCINIVFYLLLKAEGRPVRDHPVIPRLLELRAYLEKIRPIDKKLQYQMEKLLTVAQLQVSYLYPFDPLINHFLQRVELVHVACKTHVCSPLTRSCSQWRSCKSASSAFASDEHY